MTSDTTAGLAAGTPELRRLNLAMVCAALAAFGMLYSTQALLPAIAPVAADTVRLAAVGPTPKSAPIAGSSAWVE